MRPTLNNPPSPAARLGGMAWLTLLVLMLGAWCLTPALPARAGSKIIHHGQTKKKPGLAKGKGRASWQGQGHCPITRFKGRRSLFLVPGDYQPGQGPRPDKRNPFPALGYYANAQHPPKTIDIEGRSRVHLFFVDWEDKYGGQKLVFSIFHTNRDKLLNIPLASVVGESGICRQRMAYLSLFLDPGSGRSRGTAMMKKSQWDKSKAFGPRLVRVSTLKGYQDRGDGKKSPIPGKLLAEIRFKLMPAGVSLY
jgi:hypothetical protein